MEDFLRRLRENGLSIILASLFGVFIAGQAVAGWHDYNEDKKQHDRPVKTFSEYLQTGSFGEAVFENWESEFLQMGMYVILTVFLFQKGSSESKDPDKKATKHDEASSQLAKRPSAPYPVRKGGWRLMLYNHSLATAFFLFFLISFAGHALCGSRAFNEEALEHGQPAGTLADYVTSSRFWFESFQNWQSEFLAMLCIVILSIWLREKGSPESKPVAASHAETGG